MMQNQMMQLQAQFQAQLMMQSHMIAKPDLIKVKKNLSEIYGEHMHFLVYKIYNEINGKIIQLKNPNLDYQVNTIKINFYDNILDLKLYNELYISGLIEYIFDEIFGEIHEEISFGTRKYENQTTEEIITKPRIEIIKIRKNDYYRYLFLEFKGKDLKELKYKTCQEVGINYNTELKLKFIEVNQKEQERINFNNIKEKIDEPKKDLSNKNNENDNINIKYEENISEKFYDAQHNYNENDNINIKYEEHILKRFYEAQNNYYPKVNVFFYNKYLSKKNINVIIEADKTLKDLIKKYLDQIGLGAEPDYFTQRYKVIYNSQNLLKHLDKPIRNIFKFSNNPKVTIIGADGIAGAGGPSFSFDFVDVTSNKIKLKKVTYAGRPDMTHRRVCPGLNIFGICQYKSCGVRGKEVIYKVELKKEGLCFNVNGERENIMCPNCKTRFKKKTCGFWRCEYQFVGQYYDEKIGKNIEYNSEPHETNKDEFEYFDPDENGSKEWDELIIFVLPRQKIKYKK
jgi:hypothetical protein